MSQFNTSTDVESIKPIEVDHFIIGAGYGGLAAALYLAENNQKVVLCETLKYPGGCAGTFHKGAFGFETGATLFSGFHDKGLFRNWISKHDIPVKFQQLDPIIDFRTPTWSLAISTDRQTTINRFCALPDAPIEAIQDFFDYQERIANVLWPLFEDAGRLPPFDKQGIGWHLGRFWKYPQLISVMNRTMWSVLESFGLTDFEPITQYCNAVCQITIQTSAKDTEALFALSGMDYLFRGTGHIHDGIGQLGFGLVEAIRNCGGEVHLSNKVKKVIWDDGTWFIETRKGNYRAKTVYANLLPTTISKLVDNLPPPAEIAEYKAQLSKGWGAGMLYLILKDSDTLPNDAHHYQCIAKDAPKLQEGFHIFCSISARDERNKSPEGYRTATVSTHIPISLLSELKSQDAQSKYTQGVQDRMRQTLEEHLPEVFMAIESEFSGSPRTYQRFTGRESGMVGGIPPTQGWHNYTKLMPKALYPNLWMIGDTSFPGQSILASALGGIRLARFAT